jgi:hypothetical protein
MLRKERGEKIKTGFNPVAPEPKGEEEKSQPVKGYSNSQYEIR